MSTASRNLIGTTESKKKSGEDRNSKFQIPNSKDRDENLQEVSYDIVKPDVRPDVQTLFVANHLRLSYELVRQLLPIRGSASGQY